MKKKPIAVGLGGLVLDGARWKSDSARLNLSVGNRVKKPPLITTAHLSKLIDRVPDRAERRRSRFLRRLFRGNGGVAVHELFHLCKLQGDAPRRPLERSLCTGAGR